MCKNSIYFFLKPFLSHRIKCINTIDIVANKIFGLSLMGIKKCCSNFKCRFNRLIVFRHFFQCLK